MNQFETEAIATGFLDLGWQIVDPAEPADAYVINTCTVTNKADRKSRNVLHRFTNLPSQPVVVVTGCYAESAREELEGASGISFVVPNRAKNQIGALVDAFFKGEISSPALPQPDPFGFTVRNRVFHTRATLKIQDGCDNFCSFCIIPSVRGRAVSRPWDAVLATASTFLAEGRKELVLTGVNLGRWADDVRTFSDLVRAILDLPGDFRVRITSLEPDGLGEEFAELFGHPKMCPHLHLCLQSGSPRTLLSMRRQYSLDSYVSLVEKLRIQRPGLNLTTDFIVGFPGEGATEFEETLEALRSLRFGDVHVFPFSPRRGTRAVRMPDQVADPLVRARALLLRQETHQIRRQIMEELVGERRRVLVETAGPRDGPTLLQGLTEDYFPVRWSGLAPWNTFVSVRLTEVIEEKDSLVFQASVESD